MEHPNNQLETKKDARDIASGKVRMLRGRYPLRTGRRRTDRRRNRKTRVSLRTGKTLKKSEKTRRRKAMPSGITAPALKHNNAVQVAARALDAWAGLSPLAQHEMTILRPGEFNTPFVEANGSASKIPTSVINGLYTINFSTAEQNTKYILLTYCPMAGLTGASGTSSSGVGAVALQDADTITMTHIRGVSMSNTFGSTAFAGKIVPYALRADITIQVPLGNLSGSIWQGCMPLRSIIGSKLETLRLNTVDTRDAKSLVSNPRISIRAAINDRSLIHFVNNSKDVSGTSIAMTAPGELADEWVSYVILSRNFALNYDGNISPIDIHSTVHANICWWPAVDSAALNGVVSKIHTSTAATTPSQDHFAKVAETYQSDPRPWSYADLAKTAKVLLNAAESIPALSPYVSMAKMAGGLIKNILSDPLALVADYSDVIADLQWFKGVGENKWTGFSDPDVIEEIDGWLDATDDLIDLLLAKTAHAKKFRMNCLSGQQIVKHERNGLLISYLDREGNPLDYTEHMKQFRHPSFDKSPSDFEEPRQKSVQSRGESSLSLKRKIK